MNTMIDRLNKVENTGKVKNVMKAAGLDDGIVDTILEAINEMQDRVTGQTNEKLEALAKIDQVKDLNNEVEVLNRRITFSEGIIQQNEKDKRENNEKFEINRVRIQKIHNEIEILRRANRSALDMSQAASAMARENADSALKLDDLAGLEMTGDGMERI